MASELSDAKTKIKNAEQTVKDAAEDVRELKEEILRSISLLTTFCSNFPTLNIKFNIRWLDPIDAIKMLLDILGSLLGLQIPEIRDMVTQWLIKQLKPLEKDITFSLKNGLKKCFACKINPQIPQWMFDDGINIEIDQIDPRCILKINPSSEIGDMFYEGDETVDMNRFLYEVIQANGTTKTWKNKYTNKQIAIFKFVPTDSFVGYDASQEPSGISPMNKGKQNVDKRNNVINMKIHPSFQTETFITFINEYIESHRPLFTAENAVAQAMDFIYGVLGKKINLDEICLEKQAEYDETMETAIKCGIEDPNVKINDTFFDFSPQQVYNIKRKVRERKEGVINLDACGGEESYVDFYTVKSVHSKLKEANSTLSGATYENQGSRILNNAINEMADVSTNNVTAGNKTKGKWQFIINLIDAIKITLIKMILSPKINFIIITFFYLVNGQARFFDIKDFVKNIICILRDILEKLLRKLIFELLLPLVLKALSNLVKCFIKIYAERKKKQLKDSLLSLTPFASFADAGIDKAFGVAQGAANSAVDAGFDAANNKTSQGNNAQSGY